MQRYFRILVSTVDLRVEAPGNSRRYNCDLLKLFLVLKIMGAIGRVYLFYIITYINYIDDVIEENSLKFPSHF